MIQKLMKRRLCFFLLHSWLKRRTFLLFMKNLRCINYITYSKIIMINFDFQMAEDPETVSVKDPPLPSPRFTAFKEGNGNVTYYIFIEQKVLCSVPTSFTKALILWFCVHYIFHLGYFHKLHDVALFFQEFNFRAT